MAIRRRESVILTLKFYAKRSPSRYSQRATPCDRLTDEAAALVQAHGTSADAVAGDELDLGRVGPGDPVAAHLQAQPLGTGLEVERRRAMHRMPGGEQVVGLLPREGGVARTHEVFGVGRQGVAIEVAPATGGVGHGAPFGVRAAARAGLISRQGAHLAGCRRARCAS
jgi:hypothetical protein